MALNSLSCADAPVRNYTQPFVWQILLRRTTATWKSDGGNSRNTRQRSWRTLQTAEETTRVCFAFA